MNMDSLPNQDITNMPPMTSLKVQMSTRDELAEIGKKTESFDAIILRLLAFYKEHEEQLKKK